jgi:hypothetical protein
MIHEGPSTRSLRAQTWRAGRIDTALTYNRSGFCVWITVDLRINSNLSRVVCNFM